MGKKALLETWKWVWGVLGILVGAAAVISLVKQGVRVELNGLPQQLYSQYVALRDIVFHPITWLLHSFLATPFPEWLKDVIAGYVVASGAMWRASMVLRENDLEWFDKDPENMRQVLRESAKINVIDADDLIRRVERGIKDEKFYFYRAARSAVIWPRVLLRNMRQAFFSADQLSSRNGRIILRFFATQLIIVLFATGGFFIWNYVLMLSEKI